LPSLIILFAISGRHLTSTPMMEAHAANLSPSKANTGRNS
jgi:hypothetical protein